MPTQSGGDKRSCPSPPSPSLNRLVRGSMRAVRPQTAVERRAGDPRAMSKPEFSLVAPQHNVNYTTEARLPWDP